MLSDKELIENVKKLKLFQDIPYNRIAEMLGIKRNSFYNYIKGQYSFSDTRNIQLENIINTLKEE